MVKVVIIMGSKRDLGFANEIEAQLKEFLITPVMRVASAHKSPLKCYDIIKEYESNETIFITIAGRSNALSGFVDAQTFCPVIACPPPSDKFGGADIFSTLRVPSGVAPMLILEPKNAALAVAKIAGLSNPEILKLIEDYQKKLKNIIEDDDKEIKDGKR